MTKLRERKKKKEKREVSHARDSNKVTRDCLMTYPIVFLIS